LIALLIKSTASAEFPFVRQSRLKMQGMKMPGLQLEHLPVKFLRLSQLPLRCKAKAS